MNTALQTLQDKKDEFVDKSLIFFFLKDRIQIKTHICFFFESGGNATSCMAGFSDTGKYSDVSEANTARRSEKGWKHLDVQRKQLTLALGQLPQKFEVPCRQPHAA